MDQARELSKAVAVEQTGEWYQQAAALIVVVLMASFGGVIVQVIMKGLHIKTGSVNWFIPKVCDAVAVPPLVGMIIAGCLARNYLCSAYMDHYPEELSSWIRLICLSIILLRGGLELSFEGKGLTMVLLTLFPQVFEATGAAIATKMIFPLFTWPLCFAHGFTLGAVSPAVVVPSMMILHKAGYGVKKGIPTSMIAASSFDDIIAITAFGIFITVSMNQAKGGIASEEEGGDSIGFEVMMNLVQLVAGLVVGMGLGFCFQVFDKLPKNKCRMTIKLIAVLIVAIAMPIVAEVTTFRESKFVGIIFFGYMCFRMWGEDKPEEELGQIWMFCQPFLFGTVGAAVQFKDINPATLGPGIAVIFIGLTCRWIGAFLAMMEPKYTVKEKAFVAFGWIPKATVQAALGGVTIQMAKQTGDAVMIKNGKEMLTMAVFAICITAPLGAILIATLGKKWLAYDAEFDTTLAKNQEGAGETEAKDKDATVEIDAVPATPNDLIENDEEAGTSKIEDIDVTTKVIKSDSKYWDKVRKNNFKEMSLEKRLGGIKHIMHKLMKHDEKITVQSFIQIAQEAKDKKCKAKTGDKNKNE